jgi:hypothetical protein
MLHSTLRAQGRDKSPRLSLAVAACTQERRDKIAANRNDAFGQGDA